MNLGNFIVTTLKPKDANPRIKTLFVGTADGLSGLLSKESQHVFSYAAPVVAQLDQRMGIALSMPVAAESYNSTPMLPVFQTSLPEGFLKDRIVDRFSKTMRIDDMALLALAGANRVGRLRLSRSEEMLPDTVGAESLKEIMESEGTRNLFQDLCDKYLISSGISGVQPKVVLSAIDDLPGSTTSDNAQRATTSNPSIGEKSTLRGKSLIVKSSGDDYPSLAENEFHCLTIAKQAGLSVPEFWLSEDKKRLAIRRFDIDDKTGQFLGFEDMVSLQGKVNDQKYEGSYEKVAFAIEQNASPTLAQKSLNKFFESVVISIVLRNGDGHLKNFGLLYTDPSSDDCRLSPLYDLVCTTVYLPPDQLALSLAKSKSWPDRKTLIEFGQKTCHVDHPALAIDRIVDSVAQYKPESDDSGIWRKMREQFDFLG